MAHFDAEIDQEPSFDRVETEYKIYVNCLPPELNEVAIREVFNQYGAITGMFYPPKATWAYITYKSFREAERAIRELNDKKPLCLKVALAKERSVIKEEQSQKSHISEAFDERPRAKDAIAETLVSACNDMKCQKGVGRGQILNSYKHFPQSSVSDTLTENGSSASLPSPGSNNIYEMAEEEPLNTNRLWSRGVITVTPDGRRHVALGRGYTLYDFPEQEPKIEEYIAKVYEKRHNGLYEYGEDELKIQKCHMCSTKTTKHCEKCNTYYCSKACQKSDWPRHKIECERIPRLVEETINDVTLLQISKDENQTKISSKLNLTSKTIASDVKLRRPNASNAMQAENSDSINANTNIHKNADMDSSPDNGISNQNIHWSTQHDNTNTSCIKTADQPVLNATNTKDFFKQNQSPRCNNIEEDTEKSRRSNEHSSATSNYTNQNRSRRQNGAIKKTSPNQERCDNNTNLRDRKYNSDRSQSYQRNESQNDRKSTACNRENVNRQGSNTSYNDIAMNDDVTFYKDMYLSKTEFTEVEITLSLNNDKYWIYKVKDSDARTNLMMELQDVARRSRNVKPIVSNIYAALYETVWQRAMIISLNPIKVHFIDYGNIEILQKNDEIKDLPENVTKIPNFARKIRLSSATGEKYKNFKYSDRIFVRMLSIDAEKTIIVDVKEQSKNLSSHMESSPNINNVEEKFVQQENSKASNESLKASMIEMPSVLDTLINSLTEKAVPEDVVGLLQISESAQENRYSATLCQHGHSEQLEMLYSNMEEECSKIQEPMHYEPQVKELICGEGKDGWCRGFKISSTSSDLQIVAIDEARILAVNKIVPCPKKFLDIFAFGVICEVNHPNKLNVAEIYQFTAVEQNEQNRKQENVTVKLTKNDSTFVCEAVVKSWKSIIDAKPIPALSEIKSGSKVCIVSYRSHNVVFMRSLDEEAIEYYNNIMQCVAQCARTAPLLNEPPSCKDAVIAPFTDGNSYRAMVVKTQDGKAQVVYTDFGNIAMVNIKELKVLPHKLALQRSCCSARIILKDVPSDVSMNEEADYFLRKLTGEEIPLTCVYEGDPSKDGVYLTMPTKESVNDQINKLLIPTWKRDNYDDNTCYMLDNVKMVSLGNVGMTTSVFVLHVQEEGSKYYMSPHDLELYTYINEEMPKLLLDYCEKTEYYIPRKGELCIALYQNIWYRAVCLNPKESYTTAQILYIDYGNTESVEHKNIRLMPKDFLEPTAMANMCTVVNLAPVDNTGNYSPAIKQRLAELIPKNSESIVKIKIVEVISQECGQYVVELVEIKKKLIEEGLIPPS